MSAGVYASKTEQELKKERVRYNFGRFLFPTNSRAKTNLDTEGQVKFLVEESDCILGVHIIGASPNTAPAATNSGMFLFYFFLGPNSGEMIAEGVFEYGRIQKILHARHMHVRSALQLITIR